MSHTQSETRFHRLPNSVRQTVEARLQHATMSMKIWVGEQLADRQVMDEHQVVSAGRTGLKSGQVSELTVIAPLKPDGAKRLRKLFDLLNGNFTGALAVGTVHDMRFVLLDNDTKLLFTTT